MSLIAAVIYGPDDDCDGLLTEIAHGWMADGHAVAGVVQVNAGASCADIDMELEVLGSGRRISICQDLGTGSTDACRLDPAGLAEAAAAVKEAIGRPVDVVLVNKFGRMEAEGGGMLAEICATVAAGLPLVIGVPRRFSEAWNAFAGGMDVKLSCDRAAVDRWWAETRLTTAIS